MKTCSKCGQTKPLADFARHKTCRDGHRPDCKECVREYRRSRREEDRVIERRWAARRNETQRMRDRKRARDWRAVNAEGQREYFRQRAAKRRTWLDSYKRNHGCVDCGAECGRRLDFDHRPGETKLFNVAHSTTRSWGSVLAEIAKCDVRCVHCHQRRHVEQRRTAREALATPAPTPHAA